MSETLWALMAQGDLDVAWDLCAEREWHRFYVVHRPWAVAI